jgi:hypothetical protein
MARIATRFIVALMAEVNEPGWKKLIPCLQKVRHARSHHRRLWPEAFILKDGGLTRLKTIEAMLLHPWPATLFAGMAMGAAPDFGPEMIGN